MPRRDATWRKRAIPGLDEKISKARIVWQIVILPVYQRHMDTEFANSIARSAIGFQVSGARPTGHLLESWFGKVTVCNPGEDWPKADGLQMIPLLQLNLSAIQNLPSGLEGIAFLTMFVHPHKLPNERDPNGSKWCLRTYKQVENLVPISVPVHHSNIRPVPLLPYHIPRDYPSLEDCPIAVPEELEGSYSDYFQSAPGIKLGGWPYLIQSEIFWAPYNHHPSQPAYVIQIDSLHKANWSWGHDGVAYVGVGTALGHEQEWFITWQCL